MTAAFRKFAERVALAVGTPWAFIAALALIVAWAACGPFFSFSEPWQLAINSFTTIVTFLMVFIIQNTQERDFRSCNSSSTPCSKRRKLPMGWWAFKSFPRRTLTAWSKPSTGYGASRTWQR